MSDEDLPDINAVLEHVGAVTKDRRSYMTRCPFHEDRTPSLSVNTEKNLYLCHSCGKGGTGYHLIAELEGVSLGQARATIAALGIATGGTGGSDSELSGGHVRKRRRPADGKGDRPRYRPAFSRRRGD